MTKLMIFRIVDSKITVNSLEYMVVCVPGGPNLLDVQISCQHSLSEFDLFSDS